MSDYFHFLCGFKFTNLFANLSYLHLISSFGIQLLPPELLFSGMTGSLSLYLMEICLVHPQS